MATAEGTIAFSNVLTQDQYKGKDVGFNVVLTLDESSANELSGMGVKLKEYEGSMQRKFKSNYDVEILDVDGNEMELAEELPRGSKVRLLWAKGQMNSDYGLGTYLSKVKVLEIAEPQDNTDF